MTQETPTPPFRAIADMIGEHATQRPASLALSQEGRRIDYRALDAQMDRVAAALQRDGIGPQESIVIVAGTSIEYAVVFLGALRAGVAVAPLPPSSTVESLHAMIADSGARLMFVDAATAALLDSGTPGAPGKPPVRISLDGSPAGRAFHAWLAPEGARPERIEVQPEWPFNIIYSSGT
ncbi:MAG TPA: AMP-binding protein, partial [Quisquiliibacterium sp.]|nr:AMP-binding protein [Quisquiliibacterium sp.]